MVPPAERAEAQKGFSGICTSPQVYSKPRHPLRVRFVTKGAEPNCEFALDYFIALERPVNHPLETRHPVGIQSCSPPSSMSPSGPRPPPRLVRPIRQLDSPWQHTRCFERCHSGIGCQTRDFKSSGALESGAVCWGHVTEAGQCRGRDRVHPAQPNVDDRDRGHSVAGDGAARPAFESACQGPSSAKRAASVSQSAHCPSTARSEGSSTVGHFHNLKGATHAIQGHF